MLYLYHSKNIKGDIKMRVRIYFRNTNGECFTSEPLTFHEEKELLIKLKDFGFMIMNIASV